MQNHYRRLLMTAALGSCLLLSARARLRAQPIELSVSPAEQPAPALRYRLLPISSELNPGDAAPIYLRLRHLPSDADWQQFLEKTDAWASVPMDKVPITEARKFVDQWGATTKLLRIRTRRQSCDWSYPLAEQRQEAIEILMPDCNLMRGWARLLSIEARVETAEHTYTQGIDTIETGIAFGRHVGEGPFLINNLVGISICGVMLERVEELISQPGAPNLYWALTALPRPLVSLREGFEMEQRLGENLVPELAETDEPHSRAEWGVLLEKLYDRLRHLAERITSDPKVNATLRSQLDLDLASFRKENLAPSLEYLKTIRHMDALRVKTMSEDEVVARALGGQYRDMRDDQFKLGYLPWRDARSRIKEAEQRLKTVKAGPLTVLAELQSSTMKCLDAQMRLDSRVAALRVVEAIRLYAGSHDGKLPEELNQVTEVPVPEDPATGKAFEYRRDGAAAVLILPDAGMTGRPTPPYRITTRKRTNESP
jgi:hypothetical protein